MADDARQRIDDLVNRGLLDQWYAVAKSVQVKPGKPHAGEGARAEPRALARQPRRAQVHRGLLPAPRRQALARRGGGRRHRLPLSRRDARRHRQDRARAGDAGLPDGRPPPGRELSGGGIRRRDLRLFRERRASRAAAARAARGVHQPGMVVDPLRVALGLQLPLRARQPRRSDARLVSPRRQLHARVRRQAGHDAHRAERERLHGRARRAAGREFRLDRDGHRDRRALLPARYPLPGGGRSGRPVPHHRLHDAGRRGQLPRLLLAAAQGVGPRARGLALHVPRGAGRLGTGTCSNRIARCWRRCRRMPASARCSTSTTSASPASGSRWSTRPRRNSPRRTRAPRARPARRAAAARQVRLPGTARPPARSRRAALRSGTGDIRFPPPAVAPSHSK